MVECKFVDRSTADGCYVTFTDSSHKITKSFNITKPNSTVGIVWKHITLSVSGNYTITVYDIVDGFITGTPSVIHHKAVYIIPSISLVASDHSSPWTLNQLSTRYKDKLSTSYNYKGIQYRKCN